MEDKVKILKHLVKYHKADMIFSQREFRDKSGINDHEFTSLQKQLLRDGHIEISAVDDNVIITKTGREFIRKRKRERHSGYFVIIGLVLTAAAIPYWYNNSSSEVR